MTVTVSPTADEPTHDVSLESGATKYGLILARATGQPDNPVQPDPTAFVPAMVPRQAFKTQVGTSKYSDLEPPYFAIAQDNWNGGRGLDDFDLDTTRFMDSYRINTSGQGVICGPLATQGGLYFTVDAGYTSNAWYVLGYNYPKCSKYIPASSFTIRKIRIFVKNVSVGDIYGATIYSSTGTVLASGSVASPIAIGDSGDYVNVPIVYAVTASTTYYIGVSCGTMGNSISVRIKNDATGQDIRRWAAGSWDVLQSNQSMCYALYDVYKGIRRFFEFRGAMYCINQADDFSAPRLWLNGYRGCALANTNELHKVYTNATINEDLAGKIVFLSGGKGSEELTPWRTIISNTQGAGAELQVNPPWYVTHDTTTEWVILGCDSFQEITGVSGFPTKPVTDLCVLHDRIFFAQGKDDYMIRYQEYQNGGTWTRRCDPEGQKFDFIKVIPTNKGTLKLWGATSKDCYIYSGDPKTDWTDVTFAKKNDNKPCGSQDRHITGLIGYGDPQIPFVIKEGSIGGVKDDVYAEAPLGEMDAVRDFQNGKAASQLGAYLYFGLLDGLEQFYNNDMRDMGPNRDEGLPTGFTGRISVIKSYPGKLILAVDGGEDGYSSVLEYTNPGYHQIYRGALGSRIRGLFVQVMPGSKVDRLWIGEEEDMYWLPIDPNPRKKSGFTYFSGGWVESGWMYAGRIDTLKAWSAIKVFAENLSTGHASVVVEYKKDMDTSWTMLGAITTSPRQELPMNFTSHRIKYRLTLLTDDPTITPWVKAVVVEGVETLPTKYSFSMTFKITDEAEDKNGEDDSYSRAETLTDQLLVWMGACTVLTMHSILSPWDNRNVRIQSFTARPMSVNPGDQKEEHIGTLELMDV